MGKRVYHHLGIPTATPKEGEYYVDEWKVSLTPHDISEFNIQWCRYHEGSVFPELVKTVAHVAFIVEDMDEELVGKKILYGPFTPVEGWRVVFIEECGAPVELIETELTEEQVKAMEKKVFTEEGAANDL
ncbi:MAG: hypothetical protein SP4CHLAM5_03890 [Chlamydiia bacterium]|nr:hypothetical protein [Chlamydiia bacterium]MCH9618262.1 hypothetical protein [Chlamydiia bacterium]MCH9624657.1 hypothetical protein [Chlamydiia bacterium]